MTNDITSRLNADYLALLDKRLRWGCTSGECEADKINAAETIATLQSRLATVERALREHHQWHLNSGTIGLQDGKDGWIEMDNAAEYSDSGMCERTLAALAPPVTTKESEYPADYGDYLNDCFDTKSGICRMIYDDWKRTKPVTTKESGG